MSISCHIKRTSVVVLAQRTDVDIASLYRRRDAHEQAVQTTGMNRRPTLADPLRLRG